MAETADQLDILHEPEILFDEVQKEYPAKVETEETPAPEEEKGADEPADDKGEEEEKEEKKEEEAVSVKKITPYQKRINDLVKKQRTAERRTEELEREKQADKAEIERLKAGKVEKSEKPKLGNYDEYEDYVKDLADYHIEEKLKEKGAGVKELPKETTEEGDGIPTAVKVRIAEVEKEGEKKYPDFSEVALSEHIPYSDSMRETVLDSEKAVDLAYYFGSHLDEAMRISALPPVKAVKEISKIESKFTKTTTGAPPPIEPLKGGASGSKKDPNDMSQAEYEKWRSDGGGG